MANEPLEYFPIGAELKKRLQHRFPSVKEKLLLAKLTLEGVPSVFSVGQSETVYKYGTRHQHASDDQLAAGIAEMRLNHTGAAVALAKDGLERFIADERGWANDAGPFKKDFLDIGVDESLYAKFLARRGWALMDKMQEFIVQYGERIGVPVLVRSEAGAVLRDMASVCGPLLDGEFRPIPPYMRPNEGLGPHRDPKAPATLEIKAVSAKSSCFDVLTWFDYVRCGLVPPKEFSFRDFLFRPNTGFVRFRLEELKRRVDAKKDFVIIQLSLIFTAEDGTVAIIERDRGKNPDYRRITEGLTFLHSFSPNGFQDIENQIYRFFASICSHKDLSLQISPFAVALNELGFEVPDDVDAVDEAPGPRPYYLFVVGRVNVGKSFPKGFEVTPTAPKKLHKDVPGLAKLDELSVAHFKGNVDRAVFAALKHGRFQEGFGLGTATLYDLRGKTLSGTQWPFPGFTR